MFCVLYQVFACLTVLSAVCFVASVVSNEAQVGRFLSQFWLSVDLVLLVAVCVVRLGFLHALFVLPLG